MANAILFPRRVAEWLLVRISDFALQVLVLAFVMVLLQDSGLSLKAAVHRHLTFSFLCVSVSQSPKQENAVSFSENFAL